MSKSGSRVSGSSKKLKAQDSIEEEGIGTQGALLDSEQEHQTLDELKEDMS